MIKKLDMNQDDYNNLIKNLRKIIINQYKKINEIIDAMNQHNHFEDYINNPEEYDKQEENKCISCQEYNTETCGYCVDYKLYKPIQKPKQSWQKKLEEADKFFLKYLEYLEKWDIDIYIIDVIKSNFMRLHEKFMQVIEKLIKEIK